ncbi:mandelate racemase/muconate lactonizing enzyme family protein [Halalkalicoccus sp. NIPERK01]|uniref:mandelate racemase/muconate lactonizing enzyme family protein n=1 Tax=Halalkalicoccus sp. NIPERK01 TaxID=3053469 RepID=UPI00256F2263|nr:enolase C-terminal domain-like protein [Halalkalicoccus sp. NIPERK01]MDL5363834.1 enolase C-terminal domain-like protein [Halalkalicoccus sp. NIPERK01]
MDIRTIDVHRLEIPMKGSYRASVHDFSVMDSVLIVLNTADGERGIGTVDPSPGYSRQTPSNIENALINDLLPALIEVTPQSPNKLTELLDTFEGGENAKCGIEMAFLDLYCRQRGHPLAELFGGALRQKESLNAWIGIDAPEKMGEEAKQWRNKGYKSAKLKLSGDLEIDSARIETVCEMVNPNRKGMEVRADANGAYSVSDAINLARSVEHLPLAHLEQPVPFDDLEGLARVSESTSVPVMADECLLSIRHLSSVISLKAANRVKLKPMRLGSLLSTKTGIEIAAAGGRSTVVGHGFGLSPATSTEIQLTASTRGVHRPVESVGPIKMQDEPFEPTITASDGSAVLPTGAGLGVDIVDNKLHSFTTNSTAIR